MSSTGEAQRQQALMAAILQRDDGSALQAWMAERPAGVARGLQAYQANAGASAERALLATFPTVQALVGEESFAALSRACWHAEPPLRGDLSRLGACLPRFIAGSEQLADVPYLADVARLEWLLSEAERAADVDAESHSLQLLSEVDPDRLQMALMPGVALLDSAYPVVSIWKAHRAAEEPERHRDAARTKLERGEGEHALVWRSGWRGVAETIEPATFSWMRSLLAGDSLATALDRAGGGFAFEPWLVQALRRGWVLRVCKV